MEKGRRFGRAAGNPRVGGPEWRPAAGGMFLCGGISSRQRQRHRGKAGDPDTLCGLQESQETVGRSGWVAVGGLSSRRSACLQPSWRVRITCLPSCASASVCCWCNCVKMSLPRPPPPLQPTDSVFLWPAWRIWIACLPMPLSPSAAWMGN